MIIVFVDLITVVFKIVLFQISDKTCECRQGFEQSTDNDEDCIQKMYPLCGDGTWRNQMGDCWNQSRWEDYCNNTVT